MSYKLQYRNQEFAFDESIEHVFECRFMQQSLNALSLILTFNEPFVVHTVKVHLDNIHNAELKAAAVKFCQQELQHSSQHVKYNQLLKQMGYQTDEPVEKSRKLVKFLKEKFSPLTWLALHSFGEHMTHVLGIKLLTDESLANKSTVAVRFWKWHAYEECEHAQVVADTYQEMAGGYWRRVLGLGLYLLIISRINSNTYLLLKQDKNRQQSASKLYWQGTIKQFKAGGYYRAMVKAMLQFLHPKFHPSKFINEAVMVQWKRENGE